MNIIMLYPKFPDTFWSFKHALKFIGKRSSFPPLGLITVAGMLPKEWNIKLVDLNIEELKESDLQWADYAFISGMTIQKDSAKDLIARCNEVKLPVVAGGPLFTMDHESFDGIDHFILNEAELTMSTFLNDLENGEAKKIYSSSEFPEMSEASPPLWDLVNMKRYGGMAIQYSRGCPFNCDFCNITSLLGRRVRTKSTEQIIAELEDMYAAGWKKGNIFFVDDNFIGNKKHLKTSLLPALIEWHKDKKGITFLTEASINLADDSILMEMMVEAGFDSVFIGIETPEEEGLAECNKKQNENRDLVADVKTIQRFGLQVQAGFIVGFDSDKPSVFRRQIEFIQKSGIVTAMVGLLQAPKATILFKRMEKEGRIKCDASGDNVEGTTNIIPKMDLDLLVKGYKDILNYIYEPRHYYERIKTLLKEYRIPAPKGMPAISEIAALFKSFFRLGITGRERLHYWKLLAWTTFRKPRLFPLAVRLAISGYHFRKVCELHIK